MHCRGKRVSYLVNERQTRGWPRAIYTWPHFQYRSAVSDVGLALHHRYWTWARKTKAWWYILANSRHDDRWNPEIIDPSDVLLPAGEYVSKYMGSVHECRAFRVN